MDIHMQEARARGVNVREGLLAGQLCDGGVPWQAEKRVLLWHGLAGGFTPGVFDDARRVPRPLQ